MRSEGEKKKEKKEKEERKRTNVNEERGRRNGRWKIQRIEELIEAN